MDSRAKTMGGSAIMVVALVLAMIVPVGSAGASQADKVRFCHATSSVNNPYVMVTTDPSSIVMTAHSTQHMGPIFDPLTMVQGDVWGDVIPPFGDFPGLNWDATGGTAEDQCLGDDGGTAPEGVVDVVKTASTSFTRTHDWSLDKSVDPALLQLAMGDTGRLATWDVDVTYVGAADSAHTVFGTITATNSGSGRARVDSVTDGLDGTLVDCDGDSTNTEDGLPVTLEVDGSVVCTYSASVADGTGGTNTATASGAYLFSEEDANLADEPFALTGFANYAFADPTTEVNDTVSVTDNHAEFALAYPTAASTTLDAADFLAGGTQNFTYTQSFDRSDYPTRGSGCMGETINNTAAVMGDTAELDSDTASLVVQVQCEVASGSETATGRGFKWNLTKKAANNWFMYTPWTTDGAKTGLNPGPVDIVAGQSIVIGSVSGSGSAPRMLNFNLTGGWELKTVTNNVKIQPMASCGTNQNYVQPGGFSIKQTISTTSFSVPVGSTPNLCYGIHLDVVKWTVNPTWK